MRARDGFRIVGVSVTLNDHDNMKLHPWICISEISKLLVIEYGPVINSVLDRDWNPQKVVWQLLERVPIHFKF